MAPEIKKTIFMLKETIRENNLNVKAVFDSFD